MHKIFEYITEVIGWLRIVASPLLIGSGIGALIYIPQPSVKSLTIGCSIAFVGLIVGILWAVKVWQKKGTIQFLSSVMHIPELDKEGEEEPADKK
ncbi:hypothetical protein DBR32_01145 [Taibaiella sp. KBW10]|uniref:hypothetical protein n=1 Tax=Taibaiella sp. KBW10 TaxID=2153357 RepID=UPI000F5B149C|nr:hypothetical protein [Taibaiella sp. KBW10]RQO32245.1 hypothetical protein DBR32_01145 [Taibaiella sp. KBW10]